MWCQYYFFLYWTNCNQHSFQYCYIIPEGTAHLQRLGGVLGLVVPKNKTQHHEKVQKMDLESHMILGRIGRSISWNLLYLNKTHHQKKFRVQHDSLEAGAHSSPPYSSGGNTFPSFCPSGSVYLKPSYWLFMLVLARCWPWRRPPGWLIAMLIPFVAFFNFHPLHERIIPSILIKHVILCESPGRQRF